MVAPLTHKIVILIRNKLIGKNNIRKNFKSVFIRKNQIENLELELHGYNGRISNKD